MQTLWLALLSVLACVSACPAQNQPFNPHQPNVKPGQPWFEGWYTRLSTPHGSVAAGIGHFPGQKYDNPSAVCFVLLRRRNGTLSEFSHYFERLGVHGTYAQKSSTSHLVSAVTRHWKRATTQSPEGAVDFGLSAWDSAARASCDWQVQQSSAVIRVRLPGLRLNITTTSDCVDATPWSPESPNPEAWVSTLGDIVRLHWDVLTLATPAQYSLMLTPPHPSADHNHNHDHDHEGGSSSSSDDDDVSGFELMSPASRQHDTQQQASAVAASRQLHVASETAAALGLQGISSHDMQQHSDDGIMAAAHGDSTNAHQQAHMVGVLASGAAKDNAADGRHATADTAGEASSSGQLLPQGDPLSVSGGSEAVAASSAGDDGVEPLEGMVRGSGQLHMEKNWGMSFPDEWVWAQGHRFDPADTAGSGGDSGGSSGNSTMAPRLQASFVMAGGLLPHALNPGVPPVRMFVLSYHRHDSRSKSSSHNDNYDNEEEDVVFTMDPMNLPLTSSVAVQACAGVLSVQMYGLMHVAHVVAHAPPASFSAVICPTMTGFKDYSVESFSTDVHITIYKRPYPLAPLSASSVLYEDRFTGAALEFGGAYVCKSLRN